MRVPGDTKQNGWGERFVFDHADAVNVWVYRNGSDKLEAIPIKKWDDMVSTKHAKQEGFDLD